MEYMTVDAWIKAYNNGEFVVPVDPNAYPWVKRRTMEEKGAEYGMKAGFWDWFCSDASLPNRVKAIGVKLKRLAALGVIDCSLKVQLKNCCPVDGSTYDIIQLCNDDGVQVVITPSCGHTRTKGQASIWFLKEHNDEVTFPNWSGLINYLKTRRAAATA